MPVDSGGHGSRELCLVETYKEMERRRVIMNRTHLVLVEGDNSFTFYIGDVRGVELKSRFNKEELIEYLSGLYPIKTHEVI